MTNCTADNELASWLARDTIEKTGKEPSYMYINYEMHARSSRAVVHRQMRTICTSTVYDRLHLGDHAVSLDGPPEPALLVINPISRERSRVRRSAESPGARERRLERDFRHLPFIHLSLPRIYHGYFGTLAAHNTCTQRSLVPGPIPRRPPPTGSKVLPVEEGSWAWGRIVKGQGRRRPGYKGLGTR